MHLYFDESGDYAFRDDRFDCYVQCAAVCPDSLVSVVERFVRGRCDAWRVEELHGADLLPNQIQEIADFLGQTRIELCIQLTDTTLTTKDVIQQFRLSQADAYAQSLVSYRRTGGSDPAFARDLSARIKQAGLRTQIPDGEFVQATLLIDGVLQAVQRCLYAYDGDAWREDFRDFRIIVDGKLPGKRSASEKYVADMLIGILGGSKRHTLSWNPTWSEQPEHPWVQRYVADGRVELDVLFEHEIKFEPSERHAGLQLADVVANVVRRAVLTPTDELRQAYETLTRRLADRAGHCIVIARLPGVTGKEKFAPYRHIAMGPRRTELAGPRR